MKILVGYKTNNEQTRVFRIIKDNGDGTYQACSFMVMDRLDGTKYLSEGITKKRSLHSIREEDIGDVGL